MTCATAVATPAVAQGNFLPLPFKSSIVFSALNASSDALLCSAFFFFFPYNFAFASFPCVSVEVISGAGNRYLNQRCLFPHITSGLELGELPGVVIQQLHSVVRDSGSFCFLLCHVCVFDFIPMLVAGDQSSSRHHI